MAIEATIVEQLQELRRWQLQQQQELIRQQQEQRELLTSEQNRLYEALSLSVDEMSMDGEGLRDIIHQEQKKDDDLIDLDTPDEENPYKTPKTSRSFSQYVALSNENNNNSSLNLKVPRLQLGVKNAKSDFKQSVQQNNFYGQHDYSSELSILDSTQSYSLDKSQRQNTTLDDLPVPSPKKDFITLLEEKLKDSEEIVTESRSKPIVKRPFLKKGEGLVRFMPNANSNKTSKSSRGRSASFSLGTQGNNTSQCKSKNLSRANSLPKSRKSDIVRKTTTNPAPVAQQRLALKNVPPPKKKPQRKSVGFLPSPSEKKKLPDNVSDSNASDLEVKSKKELEEVRIFELLEDKAENSSFCSTSSTVIAFMQQSTPLKHKALLHSASKHQIAISEMGDETLDELVKATNLNEQVLRPQKNTKANVKVNTPAIPWDEVPIPTIKIDKTVPAVVLPYGTDMDENYEDNTSNKEMDEDDNNVSLHVRFAEYNEYKTMTDTSSISSDSQVNVNYVNEKGAWSDGSVNTDSSDIENIVLSQLKKKMQANNMLETPKTALGSHYDTDEDATEDFKNDADDNDDDDEEDETESKDETLQKEETITDEKNASHTIFKSELLKTRLQELEREIEIFRKESAALTFQRQKLQEERTKLQEERLSLQRSYEDKAKSLEIEKKRTENLLQEEKKRLTREKAALESRLKDAWEKSQKSKQERQEIEKLREQLDELKEALSQKESKWSATNARQRSQMRVLQTENSKLKQELEKMQQKKNAKVKKPVANTRVIHQINRFLADRKKISPFKNEDDCNEEVAKTPENADAMYDDLDLEPVELDEMPQENKTEKVKILKTAESIARTRNLYESLLREATGCLSENHVERRNFLNQRKDDNVKDSSDHSDEEEHDYQHEEHAEGIRTSPNRKHSKSPQQESNDYNDHGNNNVENPKPINNKQGIREVHHPDGRIEYWYPNGNVKKVFPDKCLTKMIYYNGDVRETDKNGTVKYFYASTRTWHTTLPDGLEILEFPDGQVERRSVDGTIEVTFPDGSVRIVQADGSEKWVLRDGTIAETLTNGEKVLTLPNGQREIHTDDHKRREYPDGTVKLIYANGIQETRYANGRTRVKDKDGNLIMDTHQ